jgi:hypothetical protein
MKHWTDDNKRQGRDGDVFLDDDEDLSPFEQVWINVALALGLVLFLGLVGWFLPAVVRWARGVMS